MRNLLEAIWWWTRVAVLCVVGLYVLALLFNNSGQTARLWYWFGHESDNTPIITIVVVSFLTGGVVTTTGWALLTATIGYRRTRDARRERLAFEQRQAMHQKAARLRVKPLPIARQRVAPLTTRVFASVPEVAPIATTPADRVPEAIDAAEELANVDELPGPVPLVDEAIASDAQLPPPSPPPAGA